MALGLAQALVVRAEVASRGSLRDVIWAIDGFGALSHQFARQIVRALGLGESEVRFEVKGPPPQRIAALESGEADAALIRLEEALVLSRRRPDLPTLLDFDQLLELVPLQPHGVLATTERYLAEHPRLVAAICRGLIAASRALHERYAAFAEAMNASLPEPLVGEDLVAIWERLQRAGSFAVNGGMAESYWARQIAVFDQMNPDVAGRLTAANVLAPEFTRLALLELGIFPAEWDQVAAKGG
jgi:ABC-type nitrate/sulfonate/bicarbonate transport system substrate-binding protein